MQVSRFPQRVPYSDGNREFEAYVAPAAERRGLAPVVMVTPAWAGLTPAVEAIVRDVAAQGYLAVGLDPYGRGVRGDELGDNSHLMTPLLDDRALLRRRLLAGVDLARGLAGADGARMAVLGYCFGGLCALDIARAAPDGVRCAISVHGVLTPPPPPRARSVHARVLVLHGWEDPVAPPADVLALARELTTAGADWELHAYGHARHAFTHLAANRPERGLQWHALAAHRAALAIRGFLAETLADGRQALDVG